MCGPAGRCVLCSTLRVLGWANYTNPLPPSAKKKEQEKQHKPEKRKMKGNRKSVRGIPELEDLKAPCSCWAPRDWAGRLGALGGLRHRRAVAVNRLRTREAAPGVRCGRQLCLRRLPPFLLFPPPLHPEGFPRIFPYRQP